MVRYFTLKDNTWHNAFHFLSKVILATLIQFRNAPRNGRPARYATQEQWNLDLDQLIKTFDLLVIDEGLTTEESHRIEIGLRLFARNFRELWD
jgi:hypothetical protein